MRIAYACKLLLMDDINISGVSTKCGFESVSHFNKIFRDYKGVSPSAYKKTMLSNNY
ncbi:MAG: helix-turn-helix domain-containing protein [Rikenellaceae bacterium]|nr:helix-turn-helix domain-containing protein [Rikenellaceae bacterium]